MKIRNDLRHKISRVQTEPQLRTSQKTSMGIFNKSASFPTFRPDGGFPLVLRRTGPGLTLGVTIGL